ncbi:sugar phosphate isomerase/epimerase [Agromyces endophyticus]|uniref:sugar phosphate isomerase/epimerase family protein n=1 Tax=Agromyces sp. H17E-10 TaxID=2932244 RepID=UPI001FD603B3|nr:sugar phosphate isomerase/epimerase [Agromyces sp. H17E-10]UOQ89161.1 sugar phosphate isomerase/epimerase [Agromyces sp. H17E-10]
MGTPVTAPISVQLYSVRHELADLDATLERLATAGAQAVEPFSVYDRPAELAAAAAANGLSIPTAHAPLLSDTMRFSGREVPVPPATAAFGAARALGAAILIDPMVDADRWRTADDVARTADRMNALVEPAAAEGLVVGHHNHTFEFHHRIGELTAYEHFVSLLDERVALELDVYWATAAGEDVPALVERLGSRVRALHLKDAAKALDVFAARGEYDPAVLTQCALGSGNLQNDAALAAAPAQCIPVIEFDHVGGDVLTSIAVSIAHLRAAGSHHADAAGAIA